MNNENGYHGTEEQKKLAALKAASEIQDNMVLGLGTGSTVYYLILKLAERIRGGLHIHAAATSARTEGLAAHYGIPLIPLHQAEQIHLAIDGALFREKVIASKAMRVIWIMDQSKLVPTLNGLTLPVEVVPFATGFVEEQVRAMGFISRLRRNGDGLDGNNPDRDDSGASVFLTDNGNPILDLQGKEGVDYRLMAGRLKALTGVVETGIFGNICEKIIVGTEDGVIVKSSGNHSIPSPLIQISSCQK